MRWEHARLVFIQHIRWSSSLLHSLEWCNKRIPIVVHISLQVILYSKHARTSQSRGLSIFGLFYHSSYTINILNELCFLLNWILSSTLYSIIFPVFIFLIKGKKKIEPTHLLMFRLYQPENVVYYYFFRVILYCCYSLLY